MSVCAGSQDSPEQWGAGDKQVAAWPTDVSGGPPAIRASGTRRTGHSLSPSREDQGPWQPCSPAACPASPARRPWLGAAPTSRLRAGGGRERFISSRAGSHCGLGYLVAAPLMSSKRGKDFPPCLGAQVGGSRHTGRGEFLSQWSQFEAYQIWLTASDSKLPGRAWSPCRTGGLGPLACSLGGSWPCCGSESGLGAQLFCGRSPR